MDWIPGKPGDCICGYGKTTRQHLTECDEIPAHLWDTLPPPPPDSTYNAIDFAISAIPTSPTSPPPFWSDLLAILRYADRLTHLNTRFPKEPAPGSLWIEPSLGSGRPTPSPPP
ncbi:unnamed protein product [Umbelopsis ramanniana]